MTNIGMCSSTPITTNRHPTQNAAGLRLSANMKSSFIDCPSDRSMARAANSVGADRPCASGQILAGCDPLSAYVLDPHALASVRLLRTARAHREFRKVGFRHGPRARAVSLVLRYCGARGKCVSDRRIRSVVIVGGG